MVCHFFCMVINLNKEWFDRGLTLGQFFMKWCEINCCLFYLATITICLWYQTTFKKLYYSRLEIVQHTGHMNYEDKKVFKLLESEDSDDLINQKIFLLEFTGRSLQWMATEVFVYMFFMGTMVILMVKSRFHKIGVDQGYQFCPPYLCLMANKIINNMYEDFKFGYKSKNFIQNKYVGITKSILVFGQPIDIKLNEKFFDIIYDRKVEHENMKQILTELEAIEFIKTQIEGKITRIQLDNSRVKELNYSDL